MLAAAWLYSLSILSAVGSSSFLAAHPHSNLIREHIPRVLLRSLSFSPFLSQETPNFGIHTSPSLIHNKGGIFYTKFSFDANHSTLA